MKKPFKNIKNRVRGTSTAVLISIGIHLGILVVAGGMVVFTLVDKKEADFVPAAKIERPKMELIKPKVKVKKTVKPGATQRIVSKTVQSMPEMQLPALEGMGEGLGSGIGGFELMPDISEMSLFGGTKSMAVGNDFEGTFYSFAYDRRGKEIPADREDMHAEIRRFIKADWNTMVFAPYYRSPQKLYTTHLMIPPIPSENGPTQFGVNLGEKVSPAFWMIHYKGKIARKEGGRFRFWGCADNFMVVRVNKKIIFCPTYGANPVDDISEWTVEGDEENEYGRYYMGHGKAGLSDWFELEPGVPVEMEVLFGDYEGGWFKAMLAVEDESEDYSRNREGLPVLPIFKTADLPKPLVEKLQYLLIRDEVIVDDPLKFNVY